MQINVCKKSTDYQNFKKYFAAILKFENYAFVWSYELLKQKFICIQVKAITLIVK